MGEATSETNTFFCQLSSNLPLSGFQGLSLILLHFGAVRLLSTEKEGGLGEGKWSTPPPYFGTPYWPLPALITPMGKRSTPLFGNVAMGKRSTPPIWERGYG